MKPKRIMQLILLSMLCPFLFLSEGSAVAKKVDFSGQWTLNEIESKMAEGGFRSASALVVKQDGNTLMIERTRTGRNGEERTTTETVTLDGKETVNKGESRSTTSSATWSGDGNSLTIKSKTEFERQGETIEMTRTEIWTLDKGGKTLTIESSSSSSRGDRSATLVYNKK